MRRALQESHAVAECAALFFTNIFVDDKLRQHVGAPFLVESLERISVQTNPLLVAQFVKDGITPGLAQVFSECETAPTLWRDMIPTNSMVTVTYNMMGLD